MPDTTDAGRCIHDFLPGQCAVCADHDRPDPEPSGPPEGVQFAARFPGWCSGCREEIDPGDLIERDPNYGPGYIHVGC